jgi:hypothetical protein
MYFVMEGVAVLLGADVWDEVGDEVGGTGVADGRQAERRITNRKTAVKRGIGLLIGILLDQAGCSVGIIHQGFPRLPICRGFLEVFFTLESYNELDKPHSVN